jgi:hypothetical protein
MFRLRDEPRLPFLAVARIAPETGAEVLMIGRGRDRSPSSTSWNVDELDNWTEVTDAAGDRSGYLWRSTQTKRWGTNHTVDGSDGDEEEIQMIDGRIVFGESVDVFAGLTNMDATEGTPFESQATSGDSGGAVFLRREDTWELSGIMFSVTRFPGQPGRTSVFDNLTAFADLSAYWPQIEAIVTAASLEAGDANQDYRFDQLDIVRAMSAGKYLTGQPATWGNGDWNAAPGGSVGQPPVGDGLFNQLDLVAALASGNYLQGTYTFKMQSTNLDDFQPLNVLDDVSLGTAKSIPEPAAVLLLFVGAIIAYFSRDRIGRVCVASTGGRNRRKFRAVSSCALEAKSKGHLKLRAKQPANITG